MPCYSRFPTVRLKVNVPAFEKIPEKKLRSLTVDRGKEFSMQRVLSAKLNCKVYFAEPHAPRQRGNKKISTVYGVSSFQAHFFG